MLCSLQAAAGCLVCRRALQRCTWEHPGHCSNMFPVLEVRLVGPARDNNCDIKVNNTFWFASLSICPLKMFYQTYCVLRLPAPKIYVLHSLRSTVSWRKFSQTFIRKLRFLILILFISFLFHFCRMGLLGKLAMVLLIAGEK